MPTDRYIVAPNGTRYDRQTGWAEYKDENGQWVRFSNEQQGEGSRRDARLYGSSGYLGDVYDNWAQNPEAWESQMQGRNKDLFNVVEGEYAGDSPTKYKYYELKPEVKARLGDRVQVNQLGQGGYHEVIDPSKVEWDDEFGFVTKQDNIRAPDTKDTGLNRAMPLIVAAALGGVVASAGGGLFNMAKEAFGGAGVPFIPDTGTVSTDGNWTLPDAAPGPDNIPDPGGLTQPYIENPPMPGPGETPTSVIPENINPLSPTNVADLAAPPASGPPPGWSLPAWNSLSPGAQRVILQGLSTGASAMVSSRNAQNAIDAANQRQQDQQDFETETRERRGQPPAAIATVRPRATPGGFAASGGLADKYMRPRGG